MPSARQYPSAALSNGLHCPVGLKNPALASSMKLVGVVIMFIPPASAMEHSFRRIASQAFFIATAEAEHAVSTTSAGPDQLK